MSNDQYFNDSVLRAHYSSCDIHGWKDLAEFALQSFDALNIMIVNFDGLHMSCDGCNRHVSVLRGHKEPIESIGTDDNTEAIIKGLIGEDQYNEL